MIAKLLRRLGLDRSELRAWAMYDWASSAFTTTIVAAVFPIYFQRVAGADLDPAGATTRFALATTFGLILIAVASPLLGTLADYAALKKKMLGAFAVLGVVATACMYFIQRGDWLLAAVLFVLGNIGAAGSYVFYDSLLPHIAGEEEMDRVSAAGYALGYLGGGLLLAVNLACIQMPERFGIPDAGTATRLSFLSVAIWWLLFSFPLFRRVPEPAARTEAEPPRAGHWAAIAFGRLRETLRHLRGYKQAFLMMIAFMIYNDGSRRWRYEMTPFCVELIEAGMRDSAPRFYHTNVGRGEMYETLGPLLERYDALICPTLAVSSLPADHDDGGPGLDIDGTTVPSYLGWSLTYPFNLMAWCPAMSIPSGFGAGGMPTALQIVGRTFDDPTVFRIAAAFEKAMPWAGRRPDL